MRWLSWCCRSGGLTGILLANPPIDFQVHNTLFLSRISQHVDPGTLFGLSQVTPTGFEGFWFRLNDQGYIAFNWIVGFVLSFMPLYVVGLMGMTRRAVSYTNPALRLGSTSPALAQSSLRPPSSACVCSYVSIRDRELTRYRRRSMGRVTLNG
jgi:cytochrome o ubiquinol oxidase subunit 1